MLHCCARTVSDCQQGLALQIPEQRPRRSGHSGGLPDTALRRGRRIFAPQAGTVQAAPPALLAELSFPLVIPANRRLDNLCLPLSRNEAEHGKYCLPRFIAHLLCVNMVSLAHADEMIE
jgi:hypothetical protein